MTPFKSWHRHSLSATQLICSQRCRRQVGLGIERESTNNYRFKELVHLSSENSYQEFRVASDSPTKVILVLDRKKACIAGAFGYIILAERELKKILNIICFLHLRGKVSYTLSQSTVTNTTDLTWEERVNWRSDVNPQ